MSSADRLKGRDFTVNAVDVYALVPCRFFSPQEKGGFFGGVFKKKGAKSQSQVRSRLVNGGLFQSEREVCCFRHISFSMTRLKGGF